MAVNFASGLGIIQQLSTGKIGEEIRHYRNSKGKLDLPLEIVNIIFSLALLGQNIFVEVFGSFNGDWLRV